MADGTTRVNHLPRRQELLGALGVTAADLWLADAVLWVEGASEAQAVQLVMESEFHGRERNVVVKAMPGTSRFSSRSPRQAQATYDFCHEVSDAVSPLPITMRFLFDSDEKTPEVREGIETASGGRARFLPVRELENLLLESTIIHQALSEHAESLDVPAPSLEAIQAALDYELKNKSDPKLYRGQVPGDAPGEQARLAVGSEVLDRIYWEFLTATYDKVSDGRRLIEIALSVRPSLLEPLIDIVDELLQQASRDE